MMDVFDDKALVAHKPHDALTREELASSEVLRT